jgi:ribonucleotide reductase alpha subunit
MYYTPSSPTLYHAGSTAAALVLLPLDRADDLHAIFDEYKDGAQLLKYAGGLGTDWTPSAPPARLLKTGVESQGVIPFLKIPTTSPYLSTARAAAAAPQPCTSSTGTST